MKPLVVIPTYLREEGDLALLEACFESIWDTEDGRVDILVVDDGSPNRDLVADLQRGAAGSFEVIAKDENEGFSRTVNVGLRRALEDGRDAVLGRDAILVNADIEFTQPWLDALLATEKVHGDGLADVVGALLLFPNGTIQHGGVYFSLLTRVFDHLHKHGPADLPEALVPRACPVTGALQLIRHATLHTVGIYDEGFRMAWEDVDYCLRVFLDGGECVYNPAVQAVHHESVFRLRDPSPQMMQWHAISFVRLAEKYANVNFANLVPAL